MSVHITMQKTLSIAKQSLDLAQDYLEQVEYAEAREMLGITRQMLNSLKKQDGGRDMSERVGLLEQSYHRKVDLLVDLEERQKDFEADLERLRS